VWKSPPSPESHFRIGSVTKTMTAAVILQLAQVGKLGLDDPVSKYRADVPDGDRITIAQLRAGSIRMFFHNGELPGYNTFAAHDPTNRVTIAVWMSLPVAVDGRAPAEAIAAALVGQIYEEFPGAVDPDLPAAARPPS